MKFEILFKDRQGNPVDGLSYAVFSQTAKGQLKQPLVSSVSKKGKGKGATIVGTERLVFEVKGFPTPYENWTEIGYFSYKKRMNKSEIRTITVNVPSLIINTQTFPKQNMAGTYERRTKVINTHLNKKVYLYPIVIKHTVKYGETLQKISKQHGVTLDHISKRNKDIDINNLKTGQILTIKDEIDAQREVLKDHRKYREYIKQNFEVSKNNSKVIITIEKDKKGTQLMYLNVSGAIAAVIGVGASIQIGAARTPKGKWGIFVAPGISGVQGTPSVSLEGGYVISEATSLDDLKGFGYSINANTYFLVGGSVVAGTGLTADQLLEGNFEEGTTPMMGAETGGGIGSNVQHNLSYTFVIPLN